MASPPCLYPDLDAARHALEAHVIHRWLRKHLGPALEAFHEYQGSDSHITEKQFRFELILAQWMAICWDVAAAPPRAPSPDDDAAAARAIEHLERHIEHVRAQFSNIDDADMFERLLGEAKASLLKPRRPGPKHLREIFHGLAERLVREVGFVEPVILLQIAATPGVGIDLAPRDAQRYCKEARKIISTQQIQADKHSV